MEAKNIRLLRKIKEDYQKKLGIILPRIVPDEIDRWMDLFTIFWRICNKKEIKGTSLVERKISAVFLMDEKGIFVPDIILVLMGIRQRELRVL